MSLSIPTLSGSALGTTSSQHRPNTSNRLDRIAHTHREVKGGMASQSPYSQRTGGRGLQLHDFKSILNRKRNENTSLGFWGTTYKRQLQQSLNQTEEGTCHPPEPLAAPLRETPALHVLSGQIRHASGLLNCVQGLCLLTKSSPCPWGSYNRPPDTALRPPLCIMLSLN